MNTAPTIATPLALSRTPQVDAQADSQTPAGSDPPASPVAVRAPASGGSVALTVLATIAVIFSLDWAQHLLIPLVLGILCAYTLNPLVVWLERTRVPRVVAVSAVMIGVVCALALGAYSLSGQVQTILDDLPDAAQKVSIRLTKMSKGSESTVQKVQTVATQIEKVTNQAADLASAAKQPATGVVVEPPRFKLGDFLWAGWTSAAGMIGRGSMVLLLTFFFLLAGDSYKRKLVRLAGPSLANKKITLNVLDGINESIQRYMFMLLTTNLLLAALTWAALRWIGLENAGAWAVAAGLFHLIPYFGPALTAAGVGLAVLLQFDALSTALLAAAASLLIATLVGTFVTTWMTGKIARMNTAAVFVSLLFWGWLWGVWGMLLSIPIIVIVKVVAQHVESFQSVAELLAASPPRSPTRSRA